MVRQLRRAVAAPFVEMYSIFSTAGISILIAVAIAAAEMDPAKSQFPDLHRLKLLLGFRRVARKPDPSRAAVLQRQADEAKSAGHLNRAIRLYGRAIHYTPYNAALFFLRGSALLEANRPEEAAKDFVAGLDLDPDNQTLTFLMHTANARAAEQTAERLRARRAA